MVDDVSIFDISSGNVPVVSVDTMVGGIHFFLDDPPTLIAKKLLRVNLSDLTSSGIRHFRETENLHNVRFFKNMTPEDFLKLVNGCECLIGNSSVGIRECAFMGVKVVSIEEVTSKFFVKIHVAMNESVRSTNETMQYNNLF